MKKKGDNSRKESFLQNISHLTIGSPESDIAIRCKFNFSYFDATQICAANVTDLDEKTLKDLFAKLKEFSRRSLQEWQHTCVGSGKRRQHVFESYGEFPPHSRFLHPNHVPLDVEWGRFRLDNLKRLVGFTLPKDCCKPGSGLDENTFYIVFLDLHHNFYPTSTS